MTVEELIQQSHATAIEKGWWDEDRVFAEVIALAHSELSEALEECREGKAFREIYYDEKEKPCGIAIELADLLIRVADMCAHYNIPIEVALEIKMEYNKTRPYRHGKKF